PAAGGCPLEHLQVTVRIAERGDGAPANMHLDADGLALPVINKLISGRRTSTGFPSRSSNFVLMLVPMTCSRGTPSTRSPKTRLNSMPPAETMNVLNPFSRK